LFVLFGPSLDLFFNDKRTELVEVDFPIDRQL
jgi:hypothetical protein